MLKFSSALSVALLTACRTAAPVGQPSSTAVATPQSDSSGWRPSRSIPGIAFHDSLGNPRVAGSFLYRMRAAAGSAAGVHRHGAAMRILVVSGRKFMLMGNPPEARSVIVVRAGETIVIPANTWHVEWWDEDTVEQISGNGPLTTERPPVATPYVP